MTYYQTPRLEIHPARIRENAATLLKLCAEHKVEVACVTKVASAHPEIVRAYIDAGATMLADSRTENLRAIRAMGVKVPLLLLRLPALSRVREVVEVADISLVSSQVTMQALSAAAQQANVYHKGILMVDVGDLREGVWPNRVLEVVKASLNCTHFELIGLGCNLACFGGVIPSETNMQQLIDIRNACQQQLGISLPVLSGGNSSGIPLLSENKLPTEINHFRLGESILLGRNVINRLPLPHTRQDAFVAVAEIIEIEKKASMPIGARGQDAFGGCEEFVDRGMRLRAIVNLGRQDVAINGLEPVEKGIEILGGSSDHLILDIENCERKLYIGDEVRFLPNYGALLALSTSPYVAKQVI